MSVTYLPLEAWNNTGNSTAYWRAVGCVALPRASRTAVLLVMRSAVTEIMSLIQSARLNRHDPYAYLKDGLIRLPTQRASEIAQLLPHNWQPPRLG